MAQVHNGQPGSERQLLTQKEYADRKGWSKQYVNQLVKKGRIPLQGGKIDPVVADAALARDRDPTRAPPFRTDSMAQATPPIRREVESEGSCKQMPEPRHTNRM